MEGFYSAYFTGITGNSMGLFVFQGGRVVGTDVGGMEYDGTYSIDEAHGLIVGKIVYVIKPGHALVTGAKAGGEPVRIEFGLSLPVGFSDGRVVQIDTPSGPVNARFEKIRDWQ